MIRCDDEGRITEVASEGLFGRAGSRRAQRRLAAGVGSDRCSSGLFGGTKKLSVFFFMFF